MTLGQRINLLRREKKLSQEWVAEKLNVSRQAVSKWENDLSTPDMDNLIALAKLLDTDVEYLATGELTEDMEPETLPEPEKPPAPELPKEKGKGRKRAGTLLLILAMLGNILFFTLWQVEKRDRTELEELCTSCAYSAKDAFADYAHYGTDASYWNGVAYFRSYMNGYLELYGSDGDFLECNVLYTNLLYEKEAVSRYVEELRRVMRLLYEDIDSPNAFLEMDKLNNLIEYGE